MCAIPPLSSPYFALACHMRPDTPSAQVGGRGDAPSALRWSVVSLTAAAAYVCWPLWPSLVLAAWTADLTRPLLVRLECRLKGRRRAAAVLSLLLFLVLVLPLVGVLLGVLSGAQELAQLVRQQASAKSALESIATSTAPAPQLPNDFTTLLDLVRRYGEQGASVLQNVAGVAASGLIAFFIYFAGAHVFLLHGSEVWGWVKRHVPLQPSHLERFGVAFRETGHGLLVGVGLTSATQGLVATLAYLVLGVPRWWVLGPITGLASMIPVVGSALVWGPITLGLFLTHHPIKGFVLAFLGLAVISTVDNVLRPIYARLGSLRMPTFLLFVSLFGGIVAFGAWGAILGPLVIRLWIEALALQGEAGDAASKQS
jgi:predicted PurR-regulated permease PerM